MSGAEGCGFESLQFIAGALMIRIGFQSVGFRI